MEEKELMKTTKQELPKNIEEYMVARLTYLESQNERIQNELKELDFHCRLMGGDLSKIRDILINSGLTENEKLQEIKRTMEIK